MQILKLLKLDFLNWGFILKEFCFNRMSYICEYVRKPFEKSEKVKIACWQPTLLDTPEPLLSLSPLCS